MIRETLLQQRRILDHAETSGRGRNASRFSSLDRKAVYEYDEPYASRIDYDDEDRQTTRREDQPTIVYSSTAPASQLSPTDPSGFRGLLTQDSLALIEKRIRDFKEMYDRASDLETWVCS